MPLSTNPLKDGWSGCFQDGPVQFEPSFPVVRLYLLERCKIYVVLYTQRGIGLSRYLGLTNNEHGNDDGVKVQNLLLNPIHLLNALLVTLIHFLSLQCVVLAV
jgi:hypothetical protein